jgi:tetratricopeptide (TPR) repeat protein
MKKAVTALRGRKEVPEIKHNVFLKTAAIALAVTAPLLLLRPAVSEYLGSRDFRTDQDISRASVITPEDATYHYLLGITAYSLQDEEGIRKSISSYQESLRRNPTDSRTWLAIARAYRNSGMEESGAFALRKAVSLDRNNPALIWEAGVYSLSDNRVAFATELFWRYLSMMPGEQENVYALFHMMGVNPAYILDHLVPGDRQYYSRYLSFLISNRLIEETREAWRRMRSLAPEKNEYLRYCDFLIQEGEMKDALFVWDDFRKGFIGKTAEKEPENILWNSNFELDIENGGFDWRVGRAEGVRIFKDRDVKKTGDISLSVNFDGEHNPDIPIIRQVVPVEPGQSYRLTAYVKTENITTKNGIFLEVVAHRCDPIAKQTEPLTGTNLWNRLELEFITPGTCKTVMVGVRREQSAKFDNKISGDAWIDSLSMVKTKKS